MCKKFSDPQAYEKEIARIGADERHHTLPVLLAELSPEDQPKDFDSIKAYPKTVELVGWNIVFTSFADGCGASPGAAPTTSNPSP
jgi:hypothetical protein